MRLTPAPRSGKKEKWDMANANETWIDPATMHNINVIYDYLETRKRMADRENRRTPIFSYNQISKATGINPKQVAFACQKLAYKREPYLRVHAFSYGTKNGAKCTERVELVRLTISDSENR